MASSSKDTTHKRKTANESEKEPAAGKKKSRLSKTMSKKNSTELLEALRILDPKLLVDETCFSERVVWHYSIYHSYSRAAINSARLPCLETIYH